MTNTDLSNTDITDSDLHYVDLTNTTLYLTDLREYLFKCNGLYTSNFTINTNQVHIVDSNLKKYLVANKKDPTRTMLSNCNVTGGEIRQSPSVGSNLRATRSGISIKFRM